MQTRKTENIKYHLTERHIYGSARLGMDRTMVEMAPTLIQAYPLEPNIPATEESERYLGRKYYELSNHLGNVLTVITDEKRMVLNGNNYSHYESVVVSVTDYSPFGVSLTGRTFTTTEGYRYGFNGKEEDKEGMGGGKQTYDYGFRIYNPALAKFLSVDPLFKSFPWYTPYQFAGNKPIIAVDLDGLEEYVVIAVYRDGKFKGTYFLKVPNDLQLKKDFKKGQVLYLSVDLENDIFVTPDGQATPCTHALCLSWKDYYFRYKDLNESVIMDDLGNREKAALEGFQDHPIEDRTAFNNGIDMIAIPEPDPKNIHFELDSSVLTEAGKKELNKLARKLDYFENMKISLFAHTSEEGTPEYNMELSNKRAQAVREYLLANGVKEENLVSVEGKGETEQIPGAPNADNRRVEIKIENRGYEQDNSPTSKSAHE